MATNDSITLAGKLSNAAALNQALSLARAYAPEGKIQNLTQVGGVHQVMLEVRVSEMSRQLTKRLGINFAGADGDNFGVSMLGGGMEKLTSGQVHVVTKPGSGIAIPDGFNHAEFSGPHPAGLVGTHIHFLHPVGENETVWHLGYQDVIACGRLFRTGRCLQRGRVKSLFCIAGRFCFGEVLIDNFRD